MSTVPAMDLNKKTAIMVASAEPIRKLLREMVDEADGRTRYLAGKVSAQALVNGLILWLKSLSREDRAIAVDEALRLIAAVEQDIATVEDVVKAAGVRDEPQTLVTTHVPIFGDRSKGRAEPDARCTVRGKK